LSDTAPGTDDAEVTRRSVRQLCDKVCASFAVRQCISVDERQHFK